MSAPLSRPDPSVPAASPAVVARAHHTWLDNLQGQVFGIVMTAFGLSILKAAGLITGQFAGLALLLSYTAGWSFGVVFFLVNLPFYLFALRRMGWRFTLKTAVAVVGISVLADTLPALVQYTRLDPTAAAILGGLSSGVGLIALFRHGASCGGIGIMALYLQDRTGFRAGWTQLIFDLALFAVALCFLDSKAMLLSLLGAAVLNLTIAMNHRRDWYTAY